MAITNSIKEPFGSDDVQSVVTVALELGTDDLKDRVTEKIVEIIWIAQLPERVRSWIYQLCLPHTAGTPMIRFTGKLAEPIDLASLSNRIR